MRWRSRERKCKIETHVGTGHEIAKREGVELWRTPALGWGFDRRWVGALVGAGLVFVYRGTGSRE